ncbi:hypothetical protein KUC58_07045 [Pseudomonas aeruginosa]|nr:hypothetical protein [Pseudomonas aeruginosa]ERY77900.1 hypothetical protein Q023_06467 [Pseudomonas aeruginosa BWHPSA010]MCV0130867.1 hypothetical protein [Pseudomonas aeruginosa]RCM36184.1 hypothetical protein PA157_05765 [Pseudomonas aeruginosa]WBI92463.1 hypothetical protein PALA51_02311 [Pseudomonas aeruginosa]
MVRSAMRDVVAWNLATTVVLSDYASMKPHVRNGLRHMLLDPDDTLEMAEQSEVQPCFRPGAGYHTGASLGLFPAINGHPDVPNFGRSGDRCTTGGGH